ncbi:MAG: hypothetical protein RLZZ303_3759, partial [Candidatus Hydrogenedentota bacterium]
MTEQCQGGITAGGNSVEADGAPALARQAQSRGVWACLGLIVLLGFALRMHRLGEQSIWFDEALSLAWLHEPDFLSFIRHQFQMGWSLVPAYYVLEYYWAQWIGSSVYSIRVLGVLLNTAAIPLLFL